MNVGDSLDIAKQQTTFPDQDSIEVVERKGLGHPDTLSDGLAEVISNKYAKYCRKEFGAVLHHNVDKVSLIGGLTEVDFGVGDINIPPKAILNGRMSTEFAGQKIDIKDILEESVISYMRERLPQFQPEKNLDFEVHTNDFSHKPSWYKPESLDDVPDHDFAQANDTSTCVSYWPLTPIEETVLGIEAFFYDENIQPRFDFVGQDIKVMAVRDDKEVTLTVAIPFISEKVTSLQYYEEKIGRFKDDLTERAEKLLPKKYNVTVQINPPEHWEDEYYMLATGSCIEGGEEGVVGRGNKGRGIIPIHRPTSMEAPHGKNPVYHVGKMYQVMADFISKEIAETFDCRCTVTMTSRFGAYLYKPQKITVETDQDLTGENLNKFIKEILREKDWTSIIIDDGWLLPTKNLERFKERHADISK